MKAANCQSRYAAASVFALLFFLTIAASPIEAQRDLATLHDSLQRIDDPSLLRGMIAERQNKLAERSPELLTERGLISLRLYELTASRPDGKGAQRAFEAAIERAPRYGWAHYGLGRVLTRGPDSNPFAGGLRNSIVFDDAIARVFGEDTPTRARRAFLNAVNGAPPVSLAAPPLAEISLFRWKREHLEQSYHALEQLNRTDRANADSWLAQARVQLELGQVDEAVTSVERAAERGVDRAEGARTLAMILFQSSNRDAQGAAAWLESVEHAGPEQLELLFRDVVALHHKDEIARWHQLDTTAKRQYLRELWEIRAALAGVPMHERLAEHYRRLTVAQRHFWRNSQFGAPVGNQLLLRSFADRPYDDRGMIYIRHGKPIEVIKSPGDEIGMQSWVYRNLDGNYRLLHFAAMQSQSDYDLIHKLPCGADFSDTRGRYDARLSRLGMRCNDLDRLAASADYREQAFEMIASDTDAPNFTRDLPFFFDLYTFRGSPGRTKVVAAVAVPVDKLQKTEVALSPTYRVDLSLILVDTASKRVVRQDDSVAVAATKAFKNDDLFRMHVEVAVPPSTTTLQRVIVSDPSTPGVGQLYGGPFIIPDYSTPKLMLSDIVLAEPGIDGRWHRGDVSLALVPTGRFKGGSFRVFYEVYNIAPNAAYTTEVEIEPLQKSAGQRIREIFGTRSNIKFRFDGVATDVQDGVLQELRQVDAPLGAGRYRMKIIVRDANGAEARGERVFIIPED